MKFLKYIYKAVSGYGSKHSLWEESFPEKVPSDVYYLFYVERN